jgi:hypothetical protein
LFVLFGTRNIEMRSNPLLKEGKSGTF